MLVTRMIQPKRADKGTIISLYTEHYKKYPPPVGRASGYCISCSSVSNISVLKNSPKVISRPSQSFFTRLTDTSLRWGSSILYTLEGVTPARFASSLVAQIAEPLGHGFLDGHKNHLKKEHRKKYAFACTHLRIFGKKGIMGKKIRTCVK